MNWDRSGCYDDGDEAQSGDTDDASDGNGSSSGDPLDDDDDSGCSVLII